MQRFLVLPGALLPLATASCAGFRPNPIAAREVLRELQEIRLEALSAPAGAEPGERTASGPAFDTSDGLSQDEAVAAALFLNPDLRAFRMERGVAEGELVSAGLLPNPALGLSWLHISGFTDGLSTSGLDIGLAWSPPRPGERDARKTRARARIDEVRAQIAFEETRLAADVRKAYADLLAAEERLRLADASLRLRERILTFVRDNERLGVATRLDVNLAEIEYVGARREREAIANDRERAQFQLNRLIGTPPLHSIRLESAPDPLAYRSFALDPGALESRMVERRPDLLAAKKEYEQAEESLRLAYLRRWPWPQFGPLYARDELDGRPGNRWGLGLAIELPLANLNQGEIAALEAARDELRQAFTGKVHSARAELNEAIRNLRAQERLIRLFEESMRPALDENSRLTEAGFELRGFDLLQLITTQDKVLRSRRDLIDARLEYWSAAYDLERALGSPIPGGNMEQE